MWEEGGGWPRDGTRARACQTERGGDCSGLPSMGCLASWGIRVLSPRPSAIQVGRATLRILWGPCLVGALRLDALHCSLSSMPPRDDAVWPFRCRWGNSLAFVDWTIGDPNLRPLAGDSSQAIRKCWTMLRCCSMKRGDAMASSGSTCLITLIATMGLINTKGSISAASLRNSPASQP